MVSKRLLYFLSLLYLFPVFVSKRIETKVTFCSTKGGNSYKLKFENTFFFELFFKNLCILSSLLPLTFLGLSPTTSRLTLKKLTQHVSLCFENMCCTKDVLFSVKNWTRGCKCWKTMLSTLFLLYFQGSIGWTTRNSWRSQSNGMWKSTSAWFLIQNS